MHSSRLANIAALFPLLLTLPVSAIAQTIPLSNSANCSPVIGADTLASFQKQVEAKYWQNARLVHTLPVQGATSNGLFILSPDGQTIATGSY